MAEETNRNDSESKKLLEDRKVALLTIFDVIKTKRHFFYLTLSLTLVGTLMGHFLKVSTFETSSRLFVQSTDQPSAAKYLLNQHMYQMPGSERAESYINHLRSDSFILRIAEKIKFNKEFISLNLTPPSAKSKLTFRFWKEYIFSSKSSVLQSEREKKLLMPVEQIASFLRKTVTYKSEYHSQFIGIHVRTLDADTSQLIANLIAEEFVEITNQHSLNEVREIEAFIRDKKEQTEARVREIDKQLVSFKQKNKLISTDESARSFARRLSNLESQIQDAELKEKENKKTIARLEKVRKSSLQKIFRDGSKSQDFATEETSFIIQSRIDQLKKEKSAYLAQGFKEDNWRVQKINQQIDENVARLRDTISDVATTYSHLSPKEARDKIIKIKAEQSQIKARITTLKNAKAKLQSQVDVLPNLQQEFIQLENRFKTEISSLSNLERKEKELEIQRIFIQKKRFASINWPSVQAPPHAGRWP